MPGIILTNILDTLLTADTDAYHKYEVNGGDSSHQLRYVAKVIHFLLLAIINYHVARILKYPPLRAVL